MRTLSLIACVAFIAACGGGGGGDAIGPNAPPPEAPKQVTGGPASAPTPLSFDAWNHFSSSSISYFKHEGVAGERLILRVSLGRPFSATEAARCASNDGAGTTPSSYATQIHVYDTSFARVDGLCSEDFTYTFTENGVRIFHFDYPATGGDGVVNVASLKVDESVEYLDSGTGTPTKPKMLRTDVANTFGNHPFMNYFWISATNGQKLVINAALTPPLSPDERARCSANPDSHNTRILIYDARLNRIGVSCGESLIFDIPEDGNYVLQLHFGSNRTGGFNAAVI